jgi:hypothetical protein
MVQVHAAKDVLMAAYVQAFSGTVTYERVAFAWPDKKTVAYERLIYPLVEDKEIRKFAVVIARLQTHVTRKACNQWRPQQHSC